MSHLLRSWSGPVARRFFFFSPRERRRSLPFCLVLQSTWGRSWETELGQDFTGNSRSAVDALLLKCKYNRGRLKIPSDCLEGGGAFEDAVHTGPTHHLRVGHRAEAGDKYVGLDLRHILCRETGELRNTGKKKGENRLNPQMFEQEIALLFSFKIFCLSSCFPD